MIVLVKVPGHFSRIHVTHLDKIDDGIVMFHLYIRKCKLLVPAIFFTVMIILIFYMKHFLNTYF